MIDLLDAPPWEGPVSTEKSNPTVEVGFLLTFLDQFEGGGEGGRERTSDREKERWRKRGTLRKQGNGKERSEK